METRNFRIPKATRHICSGRRALVQAGAVLLVLIAAFHPFILWRYGFEIADTGWAALLSRDFIARPDLVETGAPWYLTWAIGYFMQKISGEEVWIALREAGFIPYAITTAFVLLIMIKAEADKPAAFFGLLCASVLAYSAFSAYQLSYNSISVMLSCMALYLAVASTAYPDWRGTTLLAGCGTLITMAAASRLPSLLAIIPVGFYLYFAGSGRSPANAVAALASGLAIGSCFLLLLAWYCGHLEQYTAGLANFLRGATAGRGQSSHPGASMVSVWVQTFASALAWSGGIAMLLVVALRMTAPAPLLHYSLMAAAFFCLAFASIRRTEIYTCLPLVAAFIALADVAPGRKLFAGKAAPILLAGLILAATFPIGSTNGFRNSTMAYWLVLPFLTGICATAEGRNRILLVLFSLVAASAYRELHPYWDLRVDRLDCSFTLPAVHGIASQCARVRQTEAAAKFIVENSSEHDRIFVAQNSPGLYVLAGRQVWGSYPWPYLRSVNEVKGLLSDEHAGVPKLVVLDKQSVFNRKWPAADTGEPIQNISESKDYYPLYADFLARHGFQQVFENATWKIFSQAR